MKEEFEEIQVVSFENKKAKTKKTTAKRTISLK